MVDNQHTKITGYRDLSQDEIDLMNEVKDIGNQLDALINDIDKLTVTDKRWLNIGRTDLQKGLMSVIRAIAKPAGF